MTFARENSKMGLQNFLTSRDQKSAKIHAFQIFSKEADFQQGGAHIIN